MHIIYYVWVIDNREVENWPCKVAAVCACHSGCVSCVSIFHAYWANSYVGTQGGRKPISSLFLPKKVQLSHLEKQNCKTVWACITTITSLPLLKTYLFLYFLNEENIFVSLKSHWNAAWCRCELKTSYVKTVGTEDPLQHDVGFWVKSFLYTSHW